MPLRRRLIPVLLLALPAVAAAHDLFLKPESFFVPAASRVRIMVLNGTFTTSENAIVRSRVRDLSLAGPAGRVTLDTSALTVLATRSRITARTAGAGTYVAGLSTAPSEIDLTGKEFAAYLEEEGLEDVIEARRKDGSLDQPVRERYAKHVKAVLRAGSAGGEAWGRALGYPAEIVPLADPYSLRRGDTLRVRLLVAGAPAPAGTVLLAGGRNSAGGRIPVQKVRAGPDGTAALVLSSPGAWYVKFIHMTRSSDAPVTHVSEWATLTFALRSPAPRR